MVLSEGLRAGLNTGAAGLQRSVLLVEYMQQSALMGRLVTRRVLQLSCTPLLTQAADGC